MKVNTAFKLTAFCLLAPVILSCTTQPGKRGLAVESPEIKIASDPMYLFEMFHIQKTLRTEVTTFGSSERKQFVDGSVSLYWPAPLNMETQLIAVYPNEYTGQSATPDIIEIVEPLKKVRPGIFLEEIKYITYHDTGNNNPGANASIHGVYMASDNNALFLARSWHYTVDSTQVIHHVPDNEVTWHGGVYDSYAKSISIETCVDYGSDLYAVWQRTGKLIAMLLVKYDLEIAAVKQHHDFSGKDCPRTLRRNNLYHTAMDIVNAEYLIKKFLSGYEVTFQSLNTEFVNHYGRVIKAPLYDTEVGYIVKIVNKISGYNEERTFYSIITGANGG